MDTDLVSAIFLNDFVGWVVIFILAGLSILTFSVLIWKHAEFRDAMASSQQFLSAAGDRSGSLPGLFLICRRHPDSPLAVLTREVFVECDLEGWFLGSGEEPMAKARPIIDSTMDRVFAEEQHRLERGLHVLGLSISLAPFLGLFGTVWGILGSFQAMGNGDASLATLAPGLSTALVTTIFGLVVAIPATVMHTYLSARVREILSDLERYSGRLEPLLQREFQRLTAGA
ncbi:MAG: MotA/TolQ/ExbB proton channel family protein [Candidatus Sumerlaeia bacterium]|nr:MotA/TolQ/ExbB proton channel family protein [Candidatus Sumerlaeia bacterium]